MKYLSITLVILSFFLFSPFVTTFTFAETASNCLETNIGNPPANAPGGCETTGEAGANSVSDYASQLNDAILRNCSEYPTSDPVPGYVTVNSITQSCLDSIPSGSQLNKISEVISWLHSSVNLPGNGGNLQCVGFVQGVAIGVNKPLPAANAGEFAADVPGYKWYPVGTAQIQVGDIPVWNTHIAVAIKIPDPGHFTVAEANGGSGSVGKETYPASNAYGLIYLGFLRKL